MNSMETLQMTRLKEAGDWLLRLKEDDLSEEEMQQWLNWCESDPENLSAFERLQSLWRGIPDQAPPIHLATRPQPVRPQWHRMALAATVLAAIGLVSFVAYPRWHAIHSVAHAHISTPTHANRNAMLPDGSQMDLAAGSNVAVDYERGERSLQMQDGTAFFRVKPDKTRPFVVHAGPVSITAVGTAFNVRRNGERVVVTVEQGIVRIDNERNAALPRALQATAGYRLTYDAHSGESRLAPVNPASELAWREGRLVYDGEPLESVIENVNRYSARKITLADARLGQLKFTGTVFVDSIDTWLGALPQAFPVTVKKENGGTVLLTR